MTPIHVKSMLPRLEDNSELCDSANDTVELFTMLTAALFAGGELAVTELPPILAGLPPLRSEYEEFLSTHNPKTHDLSAEELEKYQILMRWKAIYMMLLTTNVFLCSCIRVESRERVDHRARLAPSLLLVGRLINQIDEFPDKITDIVDTDPTTYLRGVLRNMGTGDPLQDVPCPPITYPTTDSIGMLLTYLRD